jgi:4-amino-4-deoxy-L-arabinose transferase-like glycosyltransferase
MSNSHTATLDTSPGRISHSPERCRPVRLWSVQATQIIVLLIAFGLRLVYAFDISPFSDEYITMLATRSVLRTGAPILPSGMFYDHGILFVYVEALFLGLMGFTVDIARVAAAFIGMLTVALVYRVGRRWFTTRTGLIGALLLGLGSQSIIWHGRARMYCLLELSFLAGAFLLYEGIVLQDSRPYRCAGLVALGGAGLSHLLAVPYTATMVIALVVTRIWVHRREGGFPLPVRWLWPELLLGLAAGGAVLLSRLLGGPWGAAGRIAMDPASLADVGHHLLRGIAWMRLFVGWPNLIWAVMIVTGLVALSLRLARKKIRQDDPHWSYLLIIWVGSVVGLGVFSKFYADNYVIGLFPYFCLLSARELDTLCAAIEDTVVDPGARRITAWLTTAAVAALAALLVFPGALKTVTSDPLQMDRALCYVRQHWQDGDVVATFAPHASAITLGQVDFYAQEFGAAITADRVDIWTGSPVLDSVEEFADVLGRNQRVWLIVHRENWQRHYSAAYRKWTEAHMVLVFDGTGTLVYLSEL